LELKVVKVIFSLGKNNVNYQHINQIK
jgi:hypothetical protein